MIRAASYTLLTLIAILLVLCVIPGCKLKQKQTSVTVTSSDSSKVSKVLEKSETFDSIVNNPKIQIEYIVLNPCDSNGNLKPINQQVNAGRMKSKAYTRTNTKGEQELVIESECDAALQRFRRMEHNRDSVTSLLVKDYVSMKMTKQTVTNKVPLKFILLFIAAIVYGVILTILFVRTLFIKFS